MPTAKGHASFTLPAELVDHIDGIVEADLLGFRSRSEVIASAVRMFLHWVDVHAGRTGGAVQADSATPEDIRQFFEAGLVPNGAGVTPPVDLP